MGVDWAHLRSNSFASAFDSFDMPETSRSSGFIALIFCVRTFRSVGKVFRMVAARSVSTEAVSLSLQSQAT